jgi:hypothetical protein
MIAHGNTGTFMVAARTVCVTTQYPSPRIRRPHPSQSKIEAWDLKA